MSTYSANLNVMMTTARKAARSLLKDFGEVEHLQVSSKSAGDFVSKADIRAEAIIREELTNARPNYGFLGEEGGETTGADPTRRWIVDPLDGTTNFLHGMPHWAISIALEHKGEIISGIILDPVKNEMFVAERGIGAWLNDKRIRVSDRSDLNSAVFASGIPFARNPALPDFLKQLAALAPQCAGIRRWGAAALDLAYVAAGRYDGFWEKGVKPWDIAAGLIIAKEAGALVTPIDPQDRSGLPGALIVCNGNLNDRMVKIIREA